MDDAIGHRFVAAQDMRLTSEGAPRIGAVVVLYEPTGEQLRGVGELVRQCAFVVAVDNSRSLPPERRTLLAAKGVRLLANGNQGGIGGAFNRGIDALKRCGVTIAVLLDQDSSVEADYFNQMAVACGRASATEFIIGPRVFDLNARRYLPAVTFGRFGIRSVAVDDCEANALLACGFLISSGCALSIAAYERIGAFREDFVIDHVDSDYCLRATDCAVPLWMACGITLRHRIGQVVRHRFLGTEFYTSNHSAVRRYYFARNTLRLTLLHGRSHLGVALVNLLTVYQLFTVLLFESGKARKLCALLAGVADGALGRLGAFEQRHSGLAAWCSRG